jgi:hypothetical protein
MGRPLSHPIRSTVATIVAAGAMLLTVAAPAAATGPWQKSWCDYDFHDARHDQSWSQQDRDERVAVRHSECTQNEVETFGSVSKYERLNAWHYGDGSFDRDSTGPTTIELTNESPKDRGTSATSDASGESLYESEGTP